MTGAFFAGFVRTRFQTVLLERPEPVVHVLVDLVLGETVTLLQLAFELFAAAFDDVEIVIGELAPLLFDFALSLFPISFDAVPVR